MSAISFSRLAGVIFAVVALLQLVRAVSGWEIVINGMSVPVMASWIAAAVAGVLSLLGFTASN
ncbi:hypothetical protein [Hyphomicrobium sp.]|uniref:hypothetical protein n=1 Tax=Hyphomicrobium sp. TaxID=82 RepID=UPI002E37B88F|nr:hypothetical protein [Hyphomicrobium sp.]HEX2843117.1 hypothetical protein [Hyphomicrobium sp.]